jgi:hypothetical protein
MFMPEQSIICPYCKKEITLTDAISRPIRDQLTKELQSEVLKKEQELEIKEKALLSTKNKLESERQSIDEQIKQRLAEEKAKLRKDIEAEARKESALELKSLQNRNNEIEGKLQEAKKSELDLRKQRQELEERQRDLELDVARKLDEERQKIREQAEKKVFDEHRLKDLEKEKQISDMRGQIEDLKRKADQGSQQAQGEVFELELEELLKASFPLDLIAPVPKGIRGADVLQKVNNKLGQYCGTIILEVKQTKAWSDGWIVKLKEDQREVNAEIALLMTSVLPKDISNFAHLNGVWVSDYSSVIGLITALRIQLIQIASVKQASVGKNEKMEVIYNYISGPEFRHKVEAIVEGFVAMKNELDQEKRSMIRVWAKREKQIEKVLNNTARMYGDMQGIVGASLPQINSLDIKALTEGAETEEEGEFPL